MNWYLAVMKQYAVFAGRARRSEFWMFILFNILISIGINIIDAIVGTGVLGILYSLAVLVPSLAVGARRLHDTGRSGWLQLLALIPLVGIIVLIVFWAQDGQPSANAYGTNPKAAPAAAAA